VKTAALRALLLTGALLLLGSGVAAAQTQDFMFHWSPSPVIDGDGIVRPEAVYYEVWFQRGTQPEVMIGTTPDTLFIVTGEPEVTQRIRVRAVDAEGRTSEKSQWSDPIYFTNEGDNNGFPGLPAGPELQPNYPNPFNPETTIVYAVPMDVDPGMRVRLEIYAVNGQRVRRLDVDSTPGWHEVKWDGRDDAGLVASTGMYITLFAIGDEVVTNKMTMLK
jgi:hypothetical protein